MFESCRAHSVRKSAALRGITTSGRSSLDPRTGANAGNAHVRGRGKAAAACDPCVVAEMPDAIVLKRDRDLDGRLWHVWLRRALLAVLGVIPLVALFNVFGQRPTTASAEAPAAALKVYAPTRLRGGLLYMARFHVRAHQDLKDATLVLDPGWAESITINTIEPSPVGEASKDGRLSFELGHIPAGQSYLLFMDFQVNPTNVGRRSQDVELADGQTRILTIDREVTVFP